MSKGLQRPPPPTRPIARCTERGMETASSSAGPPDVDTRNYLQDVIPGEILHRILILLQPLDKFRLRLTCRRMYLAISDPAMWSSLSFDYYSTASRKALDATLDLCSHRVTTLEINGRSLFNRFPWARFAKHIRKCSSLAQLSLVGLFPSPEQLIEALSTCSLLAHITVEIKWENGIYFPNIPSLKSFEVLVEFAYDLISPLHFWLHNDFFPEKFVIGSRTHKSLLKNLYELDVFTRSPFTLPSESRFVFQAACSDGPLKFFSRYPFLEVILENGECYVPVTTCSGITSSPLLLVLSEPQCATSIPTSDQLPSVCRTTEFSEVALTLTHLDLKGCVDVTSESLREISCHCPELKFLSLNACCNALSDLSGLASISKRCLQLKGLNISNIHAIGDKTLLWNILSNFRKLFYLAVEFCTLSLDSPMQQRNIGILLFLQIGYVVPSPITNCITCRTVSDESLKVLSQLMPLSLRVLWMSEQPGARFSLNGCGLKDLLSSHPNLQCVNLCTTSVFTLPTDSTCYWSIEKINLYCPGCFITSDFVLGLIKSRRLTHCYLTARSIQLEAASRLIQAPRLICLHLGLYEKPHEPWKTKVCKAAKSRNIAEFSVNILPAISIRSHPDLKPLQYLEL